MTHADDSGAVGGGGLRLRGQNDGPATWVGSYSTNGTTSWSGCPVVPAPISGPATMTIALGPNNTITTSLNACNLNWTVSGNTVLVVAGQSCSGMANGANFTATWTSGAATRTGSVATLSGVGGTEVFTNAAGSETCSFTQTGTWTKN